MLPVEKAAYAAAIKALKDMGENVPPGEYDVSGLEVKITLPAGTKVVRSAGPLGDGKTVVKASSSLNGFAFIGLLLSRLKRFNQAEALQRVIVEAVEETLRGGDKDEVIAETEQDVVVVIERLRSLIPDRVQKTSALVKQPRNALPSIAVSPSISMREAI